MSDIPELEQRLRAFAAAPDESANWDDVRQRARAARRVPRRRVALALAACVAIGAPSLVFVGLHVRDSGSGGLDAPVDALSLTVNRIGGALSSIDVTASPEIPNASADLLIFNGAARSNPGATLSSEAVFQMQIPLTAPSGVSSGDRSAWSGTLYPSDWTGGCEGGRYTVAVIAVGPGTSLSAVLSETSAELSNDPNAEVDGATFSCQG
jgi:hypothetical protein